MYCVLLRVDFSRHFCILICPVGDKENVVGNHSTHNDDPAYIEKLRIFNECIQQCREKFPDKEFPEGNPQCIDACRKRAKLYEYE